jgi:hypothetical protein
VPGYNGGVKPSLVGPIEARILTIRGQRVMLDADLAHIYGVSTKQLNQQVKRNRDRFPGDFAFRLTVAEKARVVADYDHIKSLKFSPTLPNAFTEHGAVMLAAVLQSPTAVAASIQVVRAFIRLRTLVAEQAALVSRLDELEARYDRQFKGVFDAIRALMAPPDKPPKRIGFRAGQEGG